MKKWLLLLSLSMLLNAEEGLKKVVFDLTSGDPKVFEKNILSGIAFQKNYYEGKLQELDVAVVVHGDAYKFFVKDLPLSPYKNDKELKKVQEEFAKRIESAVKTYNVTFLLCQSGMKRKNIREEHIYPSIGFVPTSTIGLIEKQNEGYAYIPVR